MEKNMKKNICIYHWIILLYSRNYIAQLCKSIIVQSIKNNRLIHCRWFLISVAKLWDGVWLSKAMQPLPPACPWHRGGGVGACTVVAQQRGPREPPSIAGLGSWKHTTIMQCRMQCRMRCQLREFFLHWILLCEKYLNNMGLNCTGPVIHNIKFFSIANTQSEVGGAQGCGGTADLEGSLWDCFQPRWAPDPCNVLGSTNSDRLNALEMREQILMYPMRCFQPNLFLIFTSF